MMAILFFSPHIETAFGQVHREIAPAVTIERTVPEDVQEYAEDREIDPIAAAIVAGAKAQLGNIYDASYVRIPYPNGDVPANRGLCADVVVRALRAVGYDLQSLIHEDRTLNFQQYPRTWGWRGPDPNSDHRCVPNQIFYFQRFGLTLTKDVSPETLSQWQPGDLVYWDTGSPLLHAGVVSDRINEAGYPLVIHMSDKSCVEDNSLLAWPIIGHFRFPVAPEPDDQGADDQDLNDQDVDTR
jgi:uncharacterized protein YijF (DUF1287 family)